MSSAEEVANRIRSASRKLREDMERLLPSPTEQAERLERLIEIAGRPTGGRMDE